jgi:hypothetical protein
MAKNGEKYVGVSSDGACVMMGKHNGVVVKLKLFLT